MRVALCAVLLLAPASRGAVDSPLEAPLPAGFDAAKPWKLVDPRGHEVPVQFTKDTAVWIGMVNAPKPDLEKYTLVAGMPQESPRVEVADVGGKHLVFSYQGKKILQYNYGTIVPPAGVDPVFERSGYLHPIWTPGGQVITNDMPKNHLHHHGLWWAWTSSEFEGRKSNFWESGYKQGKIECVKVEETWSGPVFGGFRARHRFLNLTEEGPKHALDETWEVRVYAPARDRHLFDLVSTQTCATQSPVVIKEYRYGGVGFRGPNDWEGKDGCEFQTSEGKTRKDGHATTAKWCTMSGKISGAGAALGFLNHPSNFRFPQPMRIHPDEPFFNWAVPQGGTFSIEPGKPYVSRYRFVVAARGAVAEEMNAWWSAYGEPAKAVSLTVK